MADFARYRDLVPVDGVQPMRGTFTTAIGVIAVISLVASFATPMWLDFVLSRVGPLDCSTLIPKLDRASGRYDQASICAANTKLWVALYAVIGLHVTALAVVAALYAERLTLDIVRAAPPFAWVAGLFLLYLGVGVILLYVFDDIGGGVRRRDSSGGISRVFNDLDDYRNVLTYARDQIVRLGVGTGFFLAPNLLMFAAMFIRREDAEG